MPDGSHYPDPMPPVQAAEFQRRRRGRNVALFAALLAFALLFYAIAMVKMAHNLHPLG